jgi:hypothetical protein
MKLKYYLNLVRGKTSAINPAKIDIKHIWAVFQAWVRSLLPISQHVKQQIIWRRGEVALKSPECWKQGHCIQCGCEIVPKTTADMGCENEPFCYPEMMSKEVWKQFKVDNNIKLFD